MDINLDFPTPEWLASGWGPWAEGEKVFYNMIVDTLRSSSLSDSQAKSRTIADSVVSRCTSASSRQESKDLIGQFSIALVGTICEIPHNHIWQDILTDVVMRVRPDLTKNYREKKIWREWEDLPELCMYIADIRQDQVDDFKEKTPRKEILNYRRLTSFTARLTDAGYKPWMNWPAFNLSYALGAPWEKGMVFDCHLWIGTEWLLRCAGDIYQALCDREDDPEWEQNWIYLKPEGTALQKWQAWRRRLVELEEDWDNWDFKDTTVERIKQSIQEMDNVEKHYAKIEEEQNADNCTVSRIKGAK